MFLETQTDPDPDPSQIFWATPKADARFYPNPCTTFFIVTLVTFNWRHFQLKAKIKRERERNSSGTLLVGDEKKSFVTLFSI